MSGLVLYEILKWVFVCVWRLFVWYYLNDGLYVSLSALHDIIEMRDLCVWIGFIWNFKMIVFMCLKTLCMILFKWWPVCFSKRFIWYYWNENYVSGLVLYEIIKWVFVYVWRLCVRYYVNDRLYVSLCALYDIIEMRDLCVWIGFIWNIKMSVCMRLNALYMI